MSPTRLDDLARLNIKFSIGRQVDFDNVIRNFAIRIPESRLYNSYMIFF